MLPLLQELNQLAVVWSSDCHLCRYLCHDLEDPGSILLFQRFWLSNGVVRPGTKAGECHDFGAEIPDQDDNSFDDIMIWLFPLLTFVHL